MVHILLQKQTGYFVYVGMKMARTFASFTAKTKQKQI